MPKKAIPNSEEQLPVDDDAIRDSEIDGASRIVGPTMTADEGCIRIDVKVARQLYELFHKLTAADGKFETCQSRSFREHIQKVYRSANVQSAFEELKTQLDTLKKQRRATG